MRASCLFEHKALMPVICYDINSPPCLSNSICGMDVLIIIINGFRLLLTSVKYNKNIIIF